MTTEPQPVPTPAAPLPPAAPLAVLNPGGSDAYQDFAGGAGKPTLTGHPPINYHAYAACTGGAFHRDPSTLPAATGGVIVLLRRDLKAARKALITLRAQGHRVWVALKEAGSHQVATLLADRRRLVLFREIVEMADGCLASVPDLLPLYRGAGARQAAFIPTPYPLEETAWDFSLPEAERSGIWIGTREWEVPSRQHLAALLAVRELGVPVTVLNPDGWRGRRRLEALGYPEGRLRIVEGRLPYAAYLRLMAQHRLVFQLDRSAVPGQVAGDALLCRLPCVGGDGAIERIAFPSISGYGRSAEEVTRIAAELLLSDSTAREVEESQRLARKHLSFREGARCLGELGFGALSP